MPWAFILQKPGDPGNSFHDCRPAQGAHSTEGFNVQRRLTSGTCKNCYWYTACLDLLTDANDLTLIPELGRSKRDVLAQHIGTVREFAACNPAQFISGRKTNLPGIGVGTLDKLHKRAPLLAGEKPQAYLREPVALPPADLEIYFDIEVDPMRDICYLHGFVERRAGNDESERYVAFFADGLVKLT